MTDAARPLKMGYVVKMFPRLSETFILNEILELERRGVEVAIFSIKKPNEGRFHPQLSRLKARVFYLEDLDTKKWSTWIGNDWPELSRHGDSLWRLIGETLPERDPRRIDQIWWAAWIACRAQELGLTRLHAHFASLPSTIAYLTHRVSGIPYSFTAHAKDIFVYSPEESRIQEKIEAAEFMVTVTEYNRRYLSEQLPEIDANKIKVVHNGIDLDSFKPDPAIERDRNHVLAVGRLVPKKGFDDLLDACVLLRERGVPFRCTIVGGGVSAAELEQKRLALGLEQQVSFTGPLHVEHVRSLLQKATVFCLPCKVAPDNNLDALPTVLLESLACGIPIVSTDVSGVPEIVESGVEGLLVPADDPAALSDEIERLLGSPDLRAEFARRGREKALAKFDQQKSVGRLLDLFRGDARVLQAPRIESASAVNRQSAPRALYVCTDKGIPFGGTKGAAIHVREFLDALAAEGYAPVAAVRKRHKIDGRAPVYPVHVLNGNPRRYLTEAPIQAEADEYALNQAFLSELESLQGDREFDFVYERYSLFGVAGREFARRAGLPFVLEVNAPLIEEARAYRNLQMVQLAREIEKYLFATADHVVTVSGAVREHVLKVAPTARVTVIPNGVDIARFRPEDGSSLWRQKVASDAADAFLIGFIGRVRPWHGVDILIEAFARARKQDPALRLCIVGDVGGVAAALEQQCRTLRLDGAVTFLGAMPPAEIPAAMGAMDAMVAPYPQLESFYFSPLKIFEYMAGGKPIIASSIGQIADVLEHEVTALLVPPGDADALCAAILRLRGDVQLGSRLGQAARAEAVAEHTWRHRVREILGIMAQLPEQKTAEAI